MCALYSVNGTVMASFGGYSYLGYHGLPGSLYIINLYYKGSFKIILYVYIIKGVSRFYRNMML